MCCALKQALPSSTVPDQTNFLLTFLDVILAMQLLDGCMASESKSGFHSIFKLWQLSTPGETCNLTTLIVSTNGLKLSSWYLFISLLLAEQGCCSTDWKWLLWWVSLWLDFWVEHGLFSAHLWFVCLTHSCVSGMGEKEKASSFDKTNLPV